MRTIRHFIILSLIFTCATGAAQSTTSIADTAQRMYLKLDETKEKGSDQNLAYINYCECTSISDKANHSCNQTEIKYGSKSDGETYCMKKNHASFERVSYNKRSKNWRWRQGRYAGFYLNYNGLVSSLSDLSLPSNADYMSLTPSSIGVDINFFDFAIASNGTTSLVTGLGLESNNFRFENNISLKKDDNGYIIPDYSYDNKGINLSKSKLTTTYLNMPLLLQINLGGKAWKKNQIWISGGIVGGMLLQGYTKIKSNETGKQKEFNNLNLRNFHWGYMASVGYGDWSVMAKYYPHSIFRNGKGPEVQQVSIGIGYNFNY